MEITDISTIKDEIKKGTYKSISLWDYEENLLIPYNTGKIPVGERIKEIEQYLKAPGAEEGLYIVKCRNAFRTNDKIKPHYYYISKGDVDLSESKEQSEKQKIVIEKKTEAQCENVLSYAAVIDLKTELIEVKSENSRLKEKIAELEEELEEAIEIIEEYEIEKEELSENGGNTISKIDSIIESLSQGAIPILEKHFQIQERKIRLEEAKVANQYYQKNGNGAESYTEQAVNENQSEIEKIRENYMQLDEQAKTEFWNELENMRESDPVAYQKTYTQLYEAGIINENTE